MTLAVGSPMPDVTLTGADGQPVRLRDLLRPGGLVVYFYPKDDSPGCTVESCSFRDQYEDFVAAGADVVGISTDSPGSHERFAARHRLPFRLLSDQSKAAEKAFGIPRSFGGLLKGRVTFVFDAEGIARYVFDSQVRVHTHVSRALDEVRRLAPPVAG